MKHFNFPPASFAIRYFRTPLAHRTATPVVCGDNIYKFSQLFHVDECNIGFANQKIPKKVSCPEIPGCWLRPLVEATASNLFRNMANTSN